VFGTAQHAAELDDLLREVRARLHGQPDPNIRMEKTA
jgi:3-(3-hydroxy-phenyl)propionate hydroxylase